MTKSLISKNLLFLAVLSSFALVYFGAFNINRTDVKKKDQDKTKVEAAPPKKKKCNHNWEFHKKIGGGVGRYQKIPVKCIYHCKKCNNFDTRECDPFDLKR